MSPVAFDLSTMEIWGALLTGATVVIAPPGPLGLPDVASLLRTAGVTVAWLTAGLFHQVAETDIDALATVPVVMSGGDVLNPDTVRAVLAARRGRPVVSGYGPAENTTFTSCHVMTDPSQVAATVPIGRPIQHTTVHVLDAAGQPVPIGVTGELYTGGDGLARGYAGNAAATARAFVPDPSGHGTRLYRTGDLARWRADGTLDFVGRVDNQIKIRGFRVEPGEVAAVLRAHPGVQESVVLVAGEGEQRHLIGYVTPADGVDPAALQPSTAARLRRAAAAGLPGTDRIQGRRPVPADRQRQGRPGRAARARAGDPRGGRPAARRHRGTARRHLAAAAAAGRHPRRRYRPRGQLLRARRQLPVGGAPDVPHRRGVRRRTGPGRVLRGTHACRLRRRHRRGPAGRPGRGRCAGSAVAAAIGADRRPSAAGTAAPTGWPRPRSQAPDRPSALAPHLVRLTGDWALWRTVCLRGAGFPCPSARRAGGRRPGPRRGRRDRRGRRRRGARQRREAAGAAYAAEFTAAVRRLSAALHEAAGLPALREAVAWQNRHALTTGIDALLRRGPRASQAQHPAPAARGARRELPAALLREERQHRLLRAGGLGADRR